MAVIREGEQAAQVSSGHPGDSILSTNLLWNFSQVSSLCYAFDTQRGFYSFICLVEVKCLVMGPNSVSGCDTRSRSFEVLLSWKSSSSS